MRSRFEGVANVLRFNWPFYAAALLTLIAALLAWPWATELWQQALLLLASFSALYFAIASLLVTHWIYDRSDLYQLSWLDQLQRQPQHVALVHAGFDDLSPLLRQRYPDLALNEFDFYDAQKNPEPSIQRARKRQQRLSPSFAAAAADGRQFDSILLFLSAHEMRRPEDRASFLTASAGLLAPGGRMVVVEHLRNLANLLAYGPGFLHFHSDSAWRSSFRAARLQIENDFALTPFVRVYVLQ
ncbi:MAG: hypothetical protein K1X75_12790 [Leptospirales bacterium]|nr:hypothetical protein [Leptospirales bacterium]